MSIWEIFTFTETFREKQPQRVISVLYFSQHLKVSLLPTTYFRLEHWDYGSFKGKTFTVARHKVAIYKLSIVRQYSSMVVEYLPAKKVFALIIALILSFLWALSYILLRLKSISKNENAVDCFADWYRFLIYKNRKKKKSFSLFSFLTFFGGGVVVIVVVIIALAK